MVFFRYTLNPQIKNYIISGLKLLKGGNFKETFEK